MKRQAVLCSILLLVASLAVAQPPAIEIPQPHGPAAAKCHSNPQGPKAVRAAHKKVAR